MPIFEKAERFRCNRAAGANRKKVVAKRRRYACVYKGIAAASVPFCERGGTTARVTDFLCNKKSERSKVRSDVERKTRFELATFTLAR